MAHRIVVLGGGTGGTMMAHRLRRHFDDDQATISVVDKDDDHVYQPGLIFLPFGLTDVHELIRPRRRQLRRGITFFESEIEHVDVAEDRVTLADGTTLPYDVLVVATGVVLQPEETEGLTGPGWNERMFTFYDVPGAEQLARALEGFPGGRLVVNIVDMPIKCPIAPLEFAFLADSYFTERGLRGKVEISFVTPLDGAFTRPLAAERLAGLLAEKNIELVTEFAVGQADGEHGKLVSWDEREVPFDLLVTIPLHAGAEYVGRSEGLGDDLGFVPTDQQTLQSSVKPNIFVIGDATNVPTSKAGSVAHFEGEVLEDNIVRFLEGRELSTTYDGHANCFIESGFGKAVLIDFNYEKEPVPGHFPTAIGLPLLKESRLNHLGKLMFQWLYWHVLLPGRDIPGISSEMPESGKRRQPEQV
jgi:sulfide:quinone oxidoreductase